ncbi:hypothetical protein EDB86DRAFT_2834216 [Lactarius hatsudake]|nr:hypothetical protein EDB86DRAFT_2834216 [Lactarius hatsudake]
MPGSRDSQTSGPIPKAPGSGSHMGKGIDRSPHVSNTCIPPAAPLQHRFLCRLEAKPRVASPTKVVGDTSHGESHAGEGGIVTGGGRERGGGGAFTWGKSKGQGDAEQHAIMHSLLHEQGGADRVKGRGQGRQGEEGWWHAVVPFWRGQGKGVSGVTGRGWWCAVMRPPSA